MKWLLSSPEPNAHWWTYSIGRHPSSVVRRTLSDCQYFQIFSPQNPMGQLKPDFMLRLSELRKWKFLQTVLVIWPRWPPYPYLVKTLKIFCSKTEQPVILKNGVQHHVLKYYKIPSNDDLGLTLTYFVTRSNLVPYAFVWEKVKTMDFSEIIVIYAIKVSRWSQLNVYMKLCEYKRTRSVIDLGPSHSDLIF